MHVSYHQEHSIWEIRVGVVCVNSGMRHALVLLFGQFLAFWHVACVCHSKLPCH